MTLDEKLQHVREWCRLAQPGDEKVFQFPASIPGEAVEAIAAEFNTLRTPLAVRLIVKSPILFRGRLSQPAEIQAYCLLRSQGQVSPSKK